jgi:hypothetical protein
MSTMFAKHRDPLIAGAAGLILVVWLFGPTFAHFGTRIVGDQYSEQLTSAWCTRVFAEGLIEKLRLPWRVDDIVYEKGVLLHLSLPTLLLSLPFYPFTSTSSLFNTAMVMNFLLAFLGAYFLFRHLGKSPLVALPGAVLYALSPFCLDHFERGPLECTALGWVPIALLCVEKYPGKTPRQVVLTAGMLLAVFTANPYFGLFTTLAAAYLMLTQKDVAFARRVRRAFFTLGLASVLIAPFAWGIIAANHHPSSLTAGRTAPRNEDMQKKILSTGIVIDLASVVLPTRAFQSRFIDKSVYLGIPTIVLCALGVALASRSRRWLWLGLAALCFSMGGSMRIAGRFFQIGDDPVPMPARFLLLHVPPFTIVYSPFRAFPLVLLAAGAILTLLFEHTALGRSKLTVSIVTLGLVAEMMVGFRGGAPLPTAPAGAPKFYHLIGKDPARYGVVDLPGPQSDEEYGRYLLYQLVHRKRIPYNFQGHFAYVRGKNPPVDESRNLTLRLQIPNAPRRLDKEAAWFHCRLDCTWVRELRHFDYRYLVLHLTGNRELDEKLAHCLGGCANEVEYRDSEVLVVRAPALEARPDTP